MVFRVGVALSLLAVLAWVLALAAVVIDIVLGHGGPADLLTWLIVSLALIGALATIWLTIGLVWILRSLLRFATRLLLVLLIL